tara:strand:- start:1763 stop:2713 length:951 start_codon:yes stop_codon:yes gene_type:complete
LVYAWFSPATTAVAVSVSSGIFVLLISYWQLVEIGNQNKIIRAEQTISYIESRIENSRIHMNLIADTLVDFPEISVLDYFPALCTETNCHDNSDINREWFDINQLGQLANEIPDSWFEILLTQAGHPISNTLDEWEADMSAISNSGTNLFSGTHLIMNSINQINMNYQTIDRLIQSLEFSELNLSIQCDITDRVWGYGDDDVDFLDTVQLHMYLAKAVSYSRLSTVSRLVLEKEGGYVNPVFPFDTGYLNGTSARESPALSIAASQHSLEELHEMALAFRFNFQRFDLLPNSIREEARAIRTSLSTAARFSLQCAQ